MKKVNLGEEVRSVSDLYVYKRIGVLNRHILSVVNVENRTLDFHVHEDSDEMFYVIEGAFRLESENGAVEMQEGDMVIVPKGMRH
ncbi:MAG: cupin domain-containing protein, partial [Clostridium sp.]|nr:cupin domain-containing protein [Clostridium sp.]